MNFRTVISVLAMVASLSSCKKLASLSDGAELSYLFFDDFNRADGDFTGNTDYNVYPSVSSMTISNHRLNPLTLSALGYVTPTTDTNAATTLKVSSTLNNNAPYALITRANHVSYSSQTHAMYCGFAYDNKLTIYEDGPAAAVGTFVWTFESEVTLVFTSEGNNWTCVATDGTNTDTITFARSTPDEVNYHGVLMTSSSTTGDDFGILDLSSTRNWRRQLGVR